MTKSLLDIVGEKFMNETFKEMQVRSCESAELNAERIAKSLSQSNIAKVVVKK